MDKLELENGTNVDQGVIGFTLNTGKPMLAGGSPTIQPPLGFMNPTIDLGKLLERYHLVNSKVFNTATKIYQAEINKSWIISTPFFDKFRQNFNNTISALGFQFVVVIQSPLNVNGLIGVWFDPGNKAIYDSIKSQMVGVTTSDYMVDAFNFDATFVSLSDPKEVHITVPINNPINTINDLPHDYVFGTLNIACLAGPHFGTGVTHFTVELYGAPIMPVAHPLHPV